MLFAMSPNTLLVKSAISQLLCVCVCNKPIAVCVCVCVCEGGREGGYHLPAWDVAFPTTNTGRDFHCLVNSSSHPSKMRANDPIQEIMWSNTGDHVIQYRRSCDPTQEIMWSNTGDHVIQHRSCDPIQEIMWSNTGDHVIQHKRSCDPTQEIMWHKIRSHYNTLKLFCVSFPHSKQIYCIMERKASVLIKRKPTCGHANSVSSLPGEISQWA